MLGAFITKWKHMSNEADDFLTGGGSKSAKFDTVGDTITGRVVKTQVSQQTKMGDGTPLTWDNGDPRMQLVVTLQTALREEADDDGLRNVYVKGSKKAGSRSLHDAVRAAVEGSGAKGLEPGGTLTVCSKDLRHADARRYWTDVPLTSQLEDVNWLVD